MSSPMASRSHARSEATSSSEPSLSHGHVCPSFLRQRRRRLERDGSSSERRRPGDVVRLVVVLAASNLVRSFNFIEQAAAQGRVAVHYVDPASHNNFAFKCHRKNKTQIFAVNALDFHPRYGTFATAGSDGTCHFWDKDSKQRLKVRPIGAVFSL